MTRTPQYHIGTGGRLYRGLQYLLPALIAAPTPAKVSTFELLFGVLRDSLPAAEYRELTREVRRIFRQRDSEDIESRKEENTALDLNP